MSHENQFDPEKLRQLRENVFKDFDTYPGDSKPFNSQAYKIFVEYMSLHCLDVAEHMEHLEENFAFYRELAIHFQDAQKYYKDLVVQIGNMLGDQAKISDDGVFHEEVLIAKVPEAVRILIEYCKNNHKKEDFSPFDPDIVIPYCT